MTDVHALRPRLPRWSFVLLAAALGGCTVVGHGAVFPPVYGATGAADVHGGVVVPVGPATTVSGTTTVAGSSTSAGSTGASGATGPSPTTPTTGTTTTPPGSPWVDAPAPSQTPTRPAASAQGLCSAPTADASRGVLPVARSYLGAAAIDGHIYVTGGLVGPGISARLDILDTQTGVVVQGPDAPSRRYSHGTVAAGGRLYLLGGHGPDGRLATAERFDPTTCRWETLAPMADAHHEPAVAAVGEAVYVFGGENGPRYLASVERFDPATGRWSRRADMPRVRKGGVAATVGGRVYVFGGIDARGTLLPEVDVYDPVADRWTTSRARMPTPRWLLTATVSAGRIVLAGGARGGGSVYVREVEVFDPATETFGTVSTLASDRGCPGAAIVGDTLFVLGGCRSGCNERLESIEAIRVGG